MRGRIRTAVATVAAIVAAVAAPAGAAGADFELTGRVTDAAGAGIANICVVAFQELGDGFGLARTDDDGRYRITDLPEGPHAVSAEDCDGDPSYAPAEGEAVVGPDAEPHDVVLEPGAFISGRVTTPDGRGVAGICVEVWSEDMAVGGEIGWQLGLFVGSDTRRDGSYEIGPLAAGTYYVAFQDCRETPRLIGEVWRGAADVEDAEPIVLQPGQRAAAVDAVLDVGGTVTGEVNDEAGDRFRGACVVAFDDAGTYLASGLTDAAGAFEVGGLETGTVLVGAGTCSRAGFADALERAEPVEVVVGEASTASPFAVPVADVERHAGADRAATAALVADETVSTFRLMFGADIFGGSTVVITRSDDPVDAVVGAPLAGAYDAPLLFTGRDALPPATLAALDELAPDEAIVIGGFGAVSAHVEDELQRRGIGTRRIAGADRYATAVAIADELEIGSPFVVSGSSWADALAVAPLAGFGSPILLTERDRLPEATRAALDGAQAATIVGGTGVVSHAVDDELATLTQVVSRIAGPDRYDTNARLMRLADRSYEEAWLASGSSWSDALVAAVAAGRTYSPLLLVDGADLDRSAATAALLREEADALVDLQVVGGTRAISDAVLAELAALVPATCAETDRC